MHEYYAANKDKFRKGMDQFLSLVAPELEKASGKKYAEVFEEIPHEPFIPHTTPKRRCGRQSAR